jgi:hypothetical protein
MAATTAMATSFKSELMQALHNFLLTGGNTFKLALIKVGMAGTYGAASTNYSNITGNTDEAAGTNYSAGGGTLTRIDPTTSGTTAFTDFADLVFSTVTISAVACMIYNSTSGSRCVSVHDFGGTKTATAGDMTIQFPTPDASNAILRLA